MVPIQLKVLPCSMFECLIVSCVLSNVCDTCLLSAHAGKDGEKTKGDDCTGSKKETGRPEAQRGQRKGRGKIDCSVTAVQDVRSF
eukprot:6010859-Amphidinium_carterae.1